MQFKQQDLTIFIVEAGNVEKIKAKWKTKVCNFTL